MGTRNYQAEYRRRIERALSRGLTRSQARGHAKAGEASLRKPRDVEQARARLEAALRILRTKGNAHLRSERPLWFTLADCVAAKFLSGKTPRIVQAITFKPKAKQKGLRPVAIGGSKDFVVDPAKGDFYRSVIDQRSSVKALKRRATGAKADALEAQQLALKLLANSTSYGIFIELIVHELEKAIEVECFAPTNGPFPVKAAAVEEAGSFFHPLRNMVGRRPLQPSKIRKG